MQSAEVVGNSQREFNVSVVSDLHFPNGVLGRLEPIAADAAADERLPDELKTSRTAKTFTAQYCRRADGTLSRGQHKFGVRNLHFGFGHRLLRIRVAIRSRRCSASRHRAERELR